MKNKRVLGLDPGLARLGWAIVDTAGNKSILVGAGCFETAAEEKAGERLLVQYDRVKKLLVKYKPDSVSLEQVFFSRNISTAFMTGQVRGVIILAATQVGIRLNEFTPTAIKQAVTGDGRADKQQIHRMVKLLLHLKQAPRNDDTTDAMAAALCGSAYRNYI